MKQCLRVRPNAVEWREVDGEIVALDLRSSLYLAINASGTVLWPALVKGASHAELVELLCTQSGAPRDTASADVDGFLETLAHHHLLED